MEISSTSTDFDGINISYLASLSEGELKELLKYLASGEIDAESFLKPAILNTESMDEDEKGYWFDILPSMNGSQIERLVDILLIEHKKLTALEIKYQKEIKALNEKHLKELEDSKSNEENNA